MTIRHITSNDPEFLELCKKITPIGRIRKDHFGKRTYIGQDESSDRMAFKSRRENVDKLR